ncbi:tetratricopeptide (TPR) repeat protein [Acetoanaerobium pronyense]|uniref:Tetratricopeptide (TPR) repeat protein n=1 Tax=Acetoanaerobium pronyense TaxID=1482736 RepID=A0ABS4KGX4_9FIRM|nr:tetratricopeptide repeat protein [Acetoanaerobium pronyense]MBP2027032.1 tetratricopeptide (TPR) repeat protein [Acetoanaerobium pronyense]
MKSKIEHHLIEKTKKLVFIKIDNDLILSNHKLSTLKEVEVPVFAERLVTLATDTKGGITTIDVSSAMMYLMGIDSKFIHNDKYLKFLKTVIDSPSSFASSLAKEAYDKKSIIDSIIYSKAYIANFDIDKSITYNYALLCYQFGLSKEDEIIKNDYILESKYYFEQLVSLYDDVPLAYYYLGYIYGIKGDDEKALKSFERILNFKVEEKYILDSKKNIDILSSKTKLEKAIDLLDEDNLEDAQKILYELSLYDDVPFEVDFYMGYIERLSGNYERAIDLYENAYKKDNKNPKLMNELGICFAFIGDLEQSYEILKYAEQLDPGNIDIKCNTCVVLMNMGKLKEAREVINEAIELAPDDEIVNSCYKQLNHLESL